MTHFKLYGSLTSPYVRRLRLYLDRVPHEFEAIKDMYGGDDDRLSELNPLKRVPVMTVDGRPLWESRVIFNHLATALGRPALDLDDENALSAVDALQDQLVQAFLMAKYDHPVIAENDYFRRHADRRRRLVAFLRDQTIAGRFDRWDYPAMSLYTLLDWSAFRKTLTAEEMGGPLASFMESSRRQPLVAGTDPRKA